MANPVSLEGRVMDIHRRALEFQARYTGFRNRMVEYIRVTGSESQAAQVKDAGRLMADATFELLNDIKIKSQDLALCVGEKEMEGLARLVQEDNDTKDHVQAVADGTAGWGELSKFIATVIGMKGAGMKHEAQKLAHMILATANTSHITSTSETDEDAPSQNNATNSPTVHFSEKAAEFKSKHGYVPTKIVCVVSGMRRPRYTFYSKPPTASSSDSNAPLANRVNKRRNQKTPSSGVLVAPQRGTEVDADGFALPKIPPLRFRLKPARRQEEAS